MSEKTKYDFFEYEGKFAPVTVYKYRSLNNDFTLNMLSKNEVFFADISTFNDPFDCRVSVCYDELKDFTFLRKATREHMRRRYRGETEEKIEERTNHYMSIFESQDYQNRRPEMIIKNNEKRFEITQKEWGFFCSTLEPNNVLMWSHYAYNHTGICVGFDTLKILDSISCGVGIVKYNNYPKIMFSDPEKGTKVFMAKAKAWEYEREYRIFTYIVKSGRSFYLPVDSISEVRFGLNIDRAIIPDVISKVLVNNPNAKFYEGKLIHNSFELFFEEIKNATPYNR